MRLLEILNKGGAKGLDNISSILREARKKSGKTQQQIADEVQVSRTYYADLERGCYTPSLKVLARLSILFDIDLNFLKSFVRNTVSDETTGSEHND